MRRSVAGVLSLAMVLPSLPVHAQMVDLPPVGQKVPLSQVFDPTVLKAITVDPHNPLRFDFFVNEGQDVLPGSDPQEDSRKDQYRLLIKDFLAALTIPERQLWVNLSPYEKDRIIDERLGLTGMGRDLLAQDYLLKQVTAALLYPEEDIGRDFWVEVYRLAQEKFGTTDIPVDTFNKVWIMPDTAEVYQEGTTAVVVRNRLKVLMEADYAALQGSMIERSSGNNEAHRIAKDVMRAVIIPALEQEVNEGKNFARIRQIYNALILAAWYKKTMRASFLGKAYVDQSKVNGVLQNDAGENLRIYAQYVEAFRKGAFSYIKDEVDRYSGEVIPRKYFSGGFLTGEDFSQRVVVTSGAVDLAKRQPILAAARTSKIKIDVNLVQSDAAQNTSFKAKLPLEDSQKQSGQDDPDIDDIKKLAEAIHVLQPYEEYPVYSRSAELKKMKSQLRQMLKDAFSKYMEGEDSYDELVATFSQIIDGDETGLRSLVMSGVYTLDVFRLFRGLAMFARPTEVPMGEVLDILGLDPGIKAFFIDALARMDTVENYEEFFNGLLENIPAANKRVRDNVYTQGEDNDLQHLHAEREEQWKTTKADGHPEEWVAEKIIEAKSRFAASYLFLETLIGKTVADARNLLFLRAKREMSALEKVTEGEVPYYTLKDLLAGRIAFSDIQELAKTASNIDDISVMFSDYIAKMQQDKKDLLARKALLTGKALERVNRRLLVLENNLKNFKDKNRVMVVKKNYFADGSKGWYRAVHYVFMLGDGLWTIEVQLKTLKAAILHDIEHKVKYKRKQSKEFENYDALVKLMWLLDAVELANYCVIKEKKLTEQFFGKDAAEVQGGIDVRNIDKELRVSGQGGRLNVDGVDMPAGTIDGFSPLIRSIVPVQGIHLHGLYSSAGSKEPDLARL